MCLYASCSDCCIMLCWSWSVMVVVVVECHCCIPYRLALMLVLTFAPCACVLSFYQAAQVLHLHTWWWSQAATCAGGIFPSAIGANTLCTTTCAGGHFSIYICMYIHRICLKQDKRRGNGAQNRYSGELCIHTILHWQS